MTTLSRLIQAIAASRDSAETPLMAVMTCLILYDIAPKLHKSRQNDMILLFLMLLNPPSSPGRF